MSVNLYVKIGTHVILGRIIQSVYFNPDQPQVVVTYLSGRKHFIKTEEQLSLDEISRICTQISEIHEEPCYPSDSDDSGCPLGMANL